MMKIDLGQTIGILANLGVIAGIVFLGIELRQNNDQLQIQARQNVYEMQAEIQRNFFRNDGGLADLYWKEVLGGDLSTLESARLASYRTHLIRTMAFIYREDPEAANDSIDWMVMLFRGPGMRELWDEIRESQNNDFVRFVETNVLSAL
jgi:hypothetical protein